MLKLIPYTKQLINIGNQKHYEGQLVWSDGRVAYGWDYAPQRQSTPTVDNGGFFVGEDSYNRITLVLKNLSSVVHNSRYHGDLWCYPCWATLEHEQYHECGYVHLPAGCYKYSGAIVSLGSNGNALVYYDYKLHFMSFGSRREDTAHRPVNIANVFVYGTGVSYIGNYYSKDDNGVIYVYDSDMVLLCSYNNGTIHVSDYDGDGEISINSDYPIFNANDVVVDLELLRSLSMQVPHLNSIWVIDYFRPNGPSGTDPVIYDLYLDTVSADVRKMFQLASPTECYLTAKTPDRDNDGDVYYSGDYVLHCDILQADGYSNYIVKKTGGTYVYENGILHCFSNGTNLSVYDSQGNLVYYGAGWIDLYNLEDTGQTDTDGDTIYRGDYIALRPLSSSPSLGGTAEATFNGTDATIYDAVTGDVLAEQDNGIVKVYEDGIEIYNSLGSIATSMQPCEWDCDYTIRRDIRGTGANIKSIGGTVTHDTEGWHVEGGTIQLYSGTTLYAEGAGGGQSGGSVTIYDAQGQVEWQGSGWIDVYNLTPQGQDPQGNYLFSGGYAVRRDVTGSGIVRGSSGAYTLYDSNHDLVATESRGTVTIYTASGQIDWQGSGWIDVDNLVPIRYAGSYLVTCSVDGATGSNTIITKDSDIYVLESNRTDIVAREDGSGLVVNDNGSEIYDGPGHITTSNLDAQRTIRSYYIDANGIVEQQYPQTYQLANNVTLDLSTMDLDINSTTYGNDALELLTTQGIVYPGGVHYNKKFLISQDSKKIYKPSNNTLESRLHNGIENCFSLAWLTRW